MSYTLDPQMRWFVLDVNPEPWAVGPLSVGRRGGNLFPTMGQNQQLANYKEAVRAALQTDYDDQCFVREPYYELDFYFWRNQARYDGTNKQVQKNIADATNMQKATEDALQGVLIDNDRNVTRVSSSVVAQGPDIRGAVAFRLRWGRPELEESAEIPVFVLATIDQWAVERSGATLVDDNVWPPRS